MESRIKPGEDYEKLYKENIGGLYESNGSICLIYGVGTTISTKWNGEPLVLWYFEIYNMTNRIYFHYKCSELLSKTMYLKWL